MIATVHARAGAQDAEDLRNGVEIPAALSPAARHAAPAQLEVEAAAAAAPAAPAAPEAEGPAAFEGGEPAAGEDDSGESESVAYPPA